MHNGRLANPLDPATQALKELTGKRKKTDEDITDIARVEFLGGLYHDPDIGPYVPGENIERAIRDGAVLSKNGRNVQRGMFIDTDVNPIAYDGPRDPTGLWEHGGFTFTKVVRNQQNRIVRTRPYFPEWRTAAEGTLDETVLDFRTLGQIVEATGAYVGLGDWRPRYGRFTAELEAIG